MGTRSNIENPIPTVLFSTILDHPLLIFCGGVPDRGALNEEIMVITFLCCAKATSKFGFRMGDLVKTTVSIDDLPIGSKGRGVGFTRAAVEVELSEEPDDVYEFGPDMLAKVFVFLIF